MIKVTINSVDGFNRIRNSWKGLVPGELMVELMKMTADARLQTYNDIDKAISRVYTAKLKLNREFVMAQDDFKWERLAGNTVLPEQYRVDLDETLSIAADEVIVLLADQICNKKAVTILS